jgi:hypothetical protein
MLVASGSVPEVFVHTVAATRPMAPIEGYRARQRSLLAAIGLAISNQSSPVDPGSIEFWLVRRAARRRCPQG